MSKKPSLFSSKDTLPNEHSQAHPIASAATTTRGNLRSSSDEPLWHGFRENEFLLCGFLNKKGKILGGYT